MPSSSGTTPSSPSAVTTRSSPSSRRSSPSTRTARASAASSCSRSTGPAVRRMRSKRIAVPAAPSTSSASTRRPSCASSSRRSSGRIRSSPRPSGREASRRGCLPRRRRSSGAGSRSRRWRRFSRDEARLVTLTGPGGTGKTRLALAVAEELAAERPARFVDLSPLRDPELLAQTIAQALGLAESAVDSIAEQGRLLLVLDNFEQLLDGAPARRRAARRCAGADGPGDEPGALAAVGEHEYPVPPLPPAEAVQLFAAAPAPSIPGFALTRTTDRRRDLPPARRPAARARAGGGAHELLPPEAMLGRLERGSSSWPAAPATCRRASRRWRRRSTGAMSSCRPPSRRCSHSSRCSAAAARSSGRRGRATASLGRPRRARRREPRPAQRGLGSRCSRRSASTPPGASDD